MVSIKWQGNYYAITISKIWCRYTRLTFPRVISYVALPGGGTTDYAVEIYYEALKNGKYTSYIDKGTYMDMMYMPDALQAIVDLMEADPSKLIHRNAFNVTAMSFDPEEIAASIAKYIPGFEISYDVIQSSKIAESWPNSIDATAAKEEWGFKYEFDLDKMTRIWWRNYVRKYNKMYNNPGPLKAGSGIFCFVIDESQDWRRKETQR